MGVITAIPAVQRTLDGALSWIEKVLEAMRKRITERDPDDPGNYLDKFVTREELAKLKIVVLNAQGQLVPFTLFASGSAEAPSIASLANAGTGVYFPAEKQIGIATDKTLRAMFDESGRFLIGTARPTDSAAAGSLEIANTSGDQVFLTRYVAATGGPSVFFSHSRGAAVGTNTIVQSGDVLGGLYFRGANGSGFNIGAAIRAEVDGTPGASADMPGRLLLLTTPDGSATMAERVRIDRNGDAHFLGQVRVGGWYAGSPATLDGMAAELGISSGVGHLLAYDRGGAAYGDMNVQGTEVAVVDTAGAKRLRMIPSTFDIVSRLTATPPSLGTNLDAVWNLTSDTNLRVSVRGSDGTTRTANLTLA